MMPDLLSADDKTADLANANRAKSVAGFTVTFVSEVAFCISPMRVAPIRRRSGLCNSSERHFQTVPYRKCRTE